MSAAQHTPGPWSIDTNGDVVSGHRNVCIPYATSAADKQLMAAAPDMLAALQVARRYAYPQPATAEPVSAPDLVAMIDIAIAKATADRTPVLSLSDSEVRS